jgi:peroxiredoxin
MGGRLLYLWGAALLLSAAGTPRFELRDTSGATRSAADWRGQKAILLFFVTIDCPVANSYVPEMNRIRDDYAGRGVVVWAVQADTTVPSPKVVDYAKEYRYGFPLVIDPQQSLVKLTGAAVTPEAVVLSPEGQVLYHGRIDNRVEDFGKQRPQATVHDVRDALDAVLAGKSVEHPSTRSIGCAIPRK